MYTLTDHGTSKTNENSALQFRIVAELWHEDCVTTEWYNCEDFGIMDIVHHMQQLDVQYPEYDIYIEYR